MPHVRYSRSADVPVKTAKLGRTANLLTVTSDTM